MDNLNRNIQPTYSYVASYLPNIATFIGPSYIIMTYVYIRPRALLCTLGKTHLPFAGSVHQFSYIEHVTIWAVTILK